MGDKILRGMTYDQASHGEVSARMMRNDMTLARKVMTYDRPHGRIMRCDQV